MGVIDHALAFIGIEIAANTVDDQQGRPCAGAAAMTHPGRHDKDFAGAKVDRSFVGVEVEQAGQDIEKLVAVDVGMPTRGGIPHRPQTHGVAIDRGDIDALPSLPRHGAHVVARRGGRAMAKAICTMPAASPMPTPSRHARS